MSCKLQILHRWEGRVVPSLSLAFGLSDFENSWCIVQVQPQTGAIKAKSVEMKLLLPKEAEQS